MHQLIDQREGERGGSDVEATPLVCLVPSAMLRNRVKLAGVKTSDAKGRGKERRSSLQQSKEEGKKEKKTVLIRETSLISNPGGLRSFQGTLSIGFFSSKLSK